MSAPRAARSSFVSYLDELSCLLDRHGALARSAFQADARREEGLLHPEAFAEAMLDHSEAFAQLEADARLLPVPVGAEAGHSRFADAFAECAQVCIAAVAALDADEEPSEVLVGFLPAAMLLHEATDEILVAGRALEQARA